MRRIRLFVAATIFCGLGVALHSVAFTGAAATKEDKKAAPNIDNNPKAVKDSDKTKAMKDLQLASSLIYYGRQNKSPESLLLAAQIIHKNPTQKLTVESKIKGGDKDAKPTAATMDNSPKALVAEAKKMSNAPQVEAMAAATLKILDEESRSPATGPSSSTYVLTPGQTLNFNPISFIGGQPAMVYVDLAGINDSMVLQIRDNNFNLVSQDNVFGPWYRCQWTPATTNLFYVQLQNTGNLTVTVTVTIS